MKAMENYLNHKTLPNRSSFELPQQLAKQLGLHFSNPYLLVRAFTHCSYLNENPEVLEDNERLEFLGDAVLNFLVAAWLYHRFPEFPEGKLTSLRAALVRNEQLAEFSRQLSLGDAVLLGKGELDGNGRERAGLLGSVFEALIGALYLDQGLDSVQAFIEPLLQDACNQILLQHRDVDPKSQLQEFTQAKGLGTPQYRLVSTSGPTHQPLYVVEVLIGDEVYGIGEGMNKQAASKAAAQKALHRLGIA